MHASCVLLRVELAFRVHEVVSFLELNARERFASDVDKSGMGTVFVSAREDAHRVVALAFARGQRQAKVDQEPQAALRTVPNVSSQMFNEGKLRRNLGWHGVNLILTEIHTRDNECGNKQTLWTKTGTDFKRLRLVQRKHVRAI